ncbi:Amino acid transporter AVT1E [Dirofilaria immitis]
MLAPIITKDVNPFPSQPRKARNIRARSQSSDVSRISRSTSRNQDITAQKSSQPSVKLKPTFVQCGSLNKPRILPAIMEDVEMRLNLEMSCKYRSTKESDNVHSSCTSLPTTSDSTLLRAMTTTTTVAPTSARTRFSGLSLLSTTGKAKSIMKKIK